MTVSLTVGTTTQRGKPTLTTTVGMGHTASIPACSYTLGTENVVQVLAAVWAGVYPVLDGLEHGPVSLVVHVSEGGVVEDVHAVVEDLVLGDVDVLPGVEHAWCDIFQNSGGDLTGGLVEDVGKVVLGEQGVGGVGAVGISPGLVLVLARGVDDTS